MHSERLVVVVDEREWSYFEKNLGIAYFTSKLTTMRLTTMFVWGLISCLALAACTEVVEYEPTPISTSWNGYAVDPEARFWVRVDDDELVCTAISLRAPTLTVHPDGSTQFLQSVSDQGDTAHFAQEGWLRPVNERWLTWTTSYRLLIDRQTGELYDICEGCKPICLDHYLGDEFWPYRLAEPMNAIQRLARPLLANPMQIDQRERVFVENDVWHDEGLKRFPVPTTPGFSNAPADFSATVLTEDHGYFVMHPSGALIRNVAWAGSSYQFDADGQVIRALDFFYPLWAAQDGFYGVARDSLCFVPLDGTSSVGGVAKLGQSLQLVRSRAEAGVYTLGTYVFPFGDATLLTNQPIGTDDPMRLYRWRESSQSLDSLELGDWKMHWPAASKQFVYLLHDEVGGRSQVLQRIDPNTLAATEWDHFPTGEVTQMKASSDDYLFVTVEEGNQITCYLYDPQGNRQTLSAEIWNRPIAYVLPM